MPVIRFLIVTLVLLSIVVPAWSDDHVFARVGDVVLTHDDIDAAFAQIPEIHRAPFIRDGNRVDQLIQNLMRSKLLAADAVKNGFDEDPIIAARMKMEAENELASAWLDQVVADAPPADFEAIAHEQYLAQPESFKSAERVDVSHILISSESRPEEEARQMAADIRERLLENPQQFDEFVAEYSEDPAKASNAGRYPAVERGQMVKPFEDMAFSMQEPGEISNPVRTAYGFHILRLNQLMPPQVLPFEQVKGQLIEQARKAYLDEYRQQYLFKLVTGPIQFEEGAIEEMAKRHFGENFEELPEQLR